MNRSAFPLSLSLLILATAHAPAQKPAVDAHGDPLPKGALARVGTTRFQTDGSPWCLAFSADGKRLSAGGDSGLSQWDAGSGKPMRQLLAEGTVAAVTPDGRVMLAVVEQGPRLIDVATGKELHALKVPRGQGGPWSFSPDGRAVTFGTIEGAIHVWDVATGRQRGAVGNVRAGVNFLALAPDGRVVAEGGAEKTILLWDVASGKELPPLTARGRSMERAVFSPDGKLLAAVDVESLEDSTVRLWEVATGKEVAQFKGSSPLEFSPDGKLLAAHHGSIYGDDWLSVKLWDVAAGKERGVLKGHANAVKAFAFSPDAPQLAALTAIDDLIHVWDVTTGKAAHNFTRPLAKALAFAPDGKTVIAANETGKVQVFDAATGLLARDMGLAEKRLQGVVLSSNGRAALTNYAGASYQVWDTATGQTLGTLEARRQRAAGLAVTCPTGMLAVANERSVSLHRLPTELARFPGTLAPLQLTAADKTTHLAALDLNLKATQLKLPPLEPTLTLRHDDKVNGVAFAADGTLLATLSNEVRLWNTATGKVVKALPGSAGAVAFAPDGKTAATGAKEGGAVLLWDLATGKERGRLVGHRGPVRALAFSADNKQLASAAQDSTILIWDLTQR